MTTRIQTFGGNIGIGTNDPGGYKLRVDGSVRANSLEINGVTNAQVPSGLIAMWSGSYSSVPTGWALCDGTNGTPNLQGRFVRGADGDAPSPAAVGSTGGSNSVTLTTNMLAQHSHTGNSGNNSASHSHEFTSGNNSAGHTHAGDTGNNSASHSHEFTSGNQSANHTHSGDTGNQSASHTHSGDTGNQSANHSHPTGNQSANHTHPIGNNNRNHSHNIPDLYYQPGRDWHQGQGTQPQFGNVNWHGPWNSAATTNVNANHGHPIGDNSANHSHPVGNNRVDHTHEFTSGNQSASHSHEFTSGNNSANHTHAGDTGNQSANHTHEFTSGNQSANHTHSGDTGNQSASHNHPISIGNAGNAAAVPITNPFYALAYIMKL